MNINLKKLKIGAIKLIKKFKKTPAIPAIAVIISIISLIYSINSSNIATEIDVENANIQKDLYCIQNETFEAVKIFQKPVFSIESMDMELTGDQQGDVLDAKFDCHFNFKNYGKGIAENTKITLYLARLENPDIIFEVANKTTVNDVFPDSENPLVYNIALNLNGNQIYINKINLAFIIKLGCTDKSSNDTVSQTFWYKFTIGKNNFESLTIPEKEELTAYNEEIFY